MSKELDVLEGFMKRKTISIVIPAYNVGQFLPHIIPTYLSEKVMEDIELLIVNDGSKDNTSEIAAEFAEKYPNTIKLINKENGGHGSTINTGVLYASGKYFKVIDGDDWVDTACLEAFVKKLKHADEDIVLNSFVKVNPTTGEKKICKISSLLEGVQYKFSSIASQIVDSYAMHGTTFKTDIFKKSTPIDEHCFYVDQEYLFYPIPFVSTATYFDIPVYQYRVGDENQSMSIKNMQKNRAMHEKVIMSLVDMLEHELDDTGKKHLLENRIASLARLQIDIFLSMEDEALAEKELFSFLKHLKNKNNRVYQIIPGKKILVLRLLGKQGYKVIREIQRR